MILLSPDAVSDVERVRSFLNQKNPDTAQRALALIWSALERVQIFPNIGLRTPDPAVRQVVVRFGASGYIIRYMVMANGGILVTRIWHSREMRA